jgi:membrane protein DedA with SNARE-associated domain
MFSTEHIFQLLIAYKYIILFPIVVIEGPIATVIAGFISSLGYLNFIVAYLVIVAGDVTGDCLYYAVGRFGREHFVERWGKYIGLNPQRVIHVEKHFDKHGSRTLFIGKMTHGIGSIFLVAAGLVKMPFSKFVTANLIATFVKSLLLILIGYYFGQAITKINSAFEFIGAISISLGLAVAVFFFWYYKKKESDRKYE